MYASVPPHLVHAGDVPDEMASQERMGSTSLLSYAYTYYRPHVQWSTVQESYTKSTHADARLNSYGVLWNHYEVSVFGT